MKILISLILCATVAAKPGILNDFVTLIRGPDVGNLENGPVYGSDLGAQSNEQNNIQAKTDDKNTFQSPSLTSQFFKYLFDGVDSIVDKINTGIASEQNDGENEEQDMNYTYLGIPQKIYWFYANKGVVPIPSRGACSCPFQLQPKVIYNQKIPFNGDVRYMNLRGSTKGPFLDPYENPSQIRPSFDNRDSL